MPSHGVNFVNENNARRILLALLKQVADPRSAYPNKHLHEVGARNREERNVSLARNRPSQQRLASSGRPDQQHTLGNASAEFLEFLRFAQEFDDFLKLFLGFIYPGDVFKCDLLLLHGEQPRPALAERERLVSAGLHLADHEIPEGREQSQRRKQVDQPSPTAAAHILKTGANAFVLEGLDHFGRKIGRGCGGMKGTAISLLSLHFHASDVDLFYRSLINFRHELRDVDFLHLLRRVRVLHHLPQRHCGEQNYHPKNDRLDR